jgi:hypothetical protein
MRPGIMGILLLAGCIMACQSNKRDLTDLIYFQNLHDSLNVQVLLGNGYKVLDAKVKDGKLLVRASKMGEDFPLLCLIDLSEKRVIARKALKDLKYYEVLSDFDEGRFVYCSVYKGQHVFFYDFRKDQETAMIVGDSNLIDVGDIMLLRDNLYYIKGVYGPSLWNIGANVLHNYHYDNTTHNPQLSNISYPLDDSLVVLSCQGRGRDSLQLWAVDVAGVEKWNALTEYKGVSPEFMPQMIRDGDAFIVKSGKQVVRLSRQHGLTLAARKFDNALNWIFRLQDEVIVFSEHRKMAFPSEKSRHKVFVNSLRADSLSVAWSAGFDVTGVPQLGLVNGQLFLSDRDSIWRIDASDGRIKQSGPVKNSYIEMLTDARTGKYYLMLNSEVVIW